MRFKYILYVCVALMVACAKSPDAEMELARNAVFMAQENPNAVEYGASFLRSAQSSLRLMQDAADSKRYDAAKTYANEAKAAAENAIAAGEAGAVRVKNDAASLVSGLKGEIEETARNVNGARYSLLDLDYDFLDKSIVNAYDTSDQAEIDQAFGRYNDALAKAREVRSNLSDINNMIANAVVRKKG